MNVSSERSTLRLNVSCHSRDKKFLVSMTLLLTRFLFVELEIRTIFFIAIDVGDVSARAFTCIFVYKSCACRI